MAIATVEASPLSPTGNSRDVFRKNNRNVSFNTTPAAISIDTKSHTIPSTTSSSQQQPMRLRRRSSQGSVVTMQNSVPKIGPQRTTKKTQKLKLLPNPEFGEDGPDEESGRDVYSQYTRIKDPTARRDAARLGKSDRDRLPRVTAYCTASKYQLENMMRFLKGRGAARGANPKLVDECIYTPFEYDRQSNDEVQPTPIDPYGKSSPGAIIDDSNKSSNRRGDLIDLRNEGDSSHNNRENGTSNNSDRNHTEVITSENSPDFDTQVHTPEVFLFDYGVVVIWGMSLQHEQQFLKEIAKFEDEKLAPDDVETECFNFYYTREYQARIYNDFITLRDKGAYMTKLAISHALAQSVKTSMFEELVDNTIEACKDIPGQIATTGKIALSRTQINMQIGELFILRINIHLNGSVLDTPEIFWLEPQLEPVYQAVRSYLEMDQRVSLLTDRLDVIADLLAVLKDQLSHGHGEMLEWIVIVLIAAEILVAAVNIIVDIYAGLD
ncbi:BgTH12-02492 [Blumeria graminis f. sp. triticale]|uniref:Bgt-2901 n=3 Tax=Blumeria graminis TaxID=34373 RepID=A0A381LE43_BLUGR|nr:Cytoplasmic protein [Blumeria graminis f. sp. tritici 96224]CAD6502253.1 BgTH12-02492 [Blumeria graminis f. sp. triticale]VDB86319.1 Bgt-2901 [Blumeria graminis f. sp. tritici]